MILFFVGLLWCIENEEKILTAEHENIKTSELMKKTLTSEEILSTLPSSRSVNLFSRIIIKRVLIFGSPE